MESVYILAAALEAVEIQLEEDIDVKELAKQCFCSESSLQKIFRYAFSYSVAEYIRKRRLSVAASNLLRTEQTITELAFRYQYNSIEAFTRAFQRFWGVSLSHFRQTHRFTALFPRHAILIEEGEMNMTKSRTIDISMLYDQLKSMQDTYLLCVDICGFHQINLTYGYTAGDIILARTAKRIEECIDETMLLFRVGRDEFAVVSGYRGLADAKDLAARITAQNGMTELVQEKEISLSMRVGISQIPGGGLSYKEVLDQMMASLDITRQGNSAIGLL